ncbi:MAG: hypothetical protein Aurels2KO_45350 [Aureliella sp.]
MVLVGALFLGLAVEPAFSAPVPPGEAFVYKTVVDGENQRELRIYVTQADAAKREENNARRPAIVFFHGGGWVGGSPGQFSEHAAYFASRGVVCFQVEYRLLDKKSKLPPLTCTSDAVSAMQWVRSRSDQFGVDPNRIATGGGSAGGHLASYLGTIAPKNVTEGVSVRPNAMLLFNPVYDNGPGGWGTARVKDRVAEFSPMHNVDRETPPNIVFLGTQDDLIPVATGERFQTKCREVSVESELHTYDGQGHGFFNVNRDGGKWFEKTLVASDRFLQKLGWIKGEHTVPSAIAESVVLITLDGLRGEEVFSGADPRLLLPELGVDDAEAYRMEFVSDDKSVARQRLLPFLWGKVDSAGWIAGNVASDSLIQVTNGRFFSYPGYNELLTGNADDQIDSNDKKYNPNTTVLEWLNKQEDLNGAVAAYCSWDVFPFIINDRRSGVRVNAGWMPFEVGDSRAVSALNLVSNNIIREWGSVRYDSLTAAGAIEELKTKRPRVLYVSLGETDDWAHKGRYDRYLRSAKQNDQLIRELWETVQSLPSHRDKTAFFITTDHGRGDGREGWKNHSNKLPGSEFVWAAAFGAGVSARGEDERGRFTQSQVAATVAKLIGRDFRGVGDDKAAKPLPIVGMPSFLPR